MPGGLDAQVTMEDQKKWDGKGSPLEQWKKVAPPTINTARLIYKLIWLIYKLIDCVMCNLYVCVLSWVPGRVASWLKASPGKNKSSNPIQSNTSDVTDNITHFLAKNV